MVAWRDENIMEGSLDDSPTSGRVLFLIASNADAVAFKLRWCDGLDFVN